MDDKLVQQWLDGETTDRPSDADLADYQRLYKALAEEPEGRLSNGFAASVVQRISESQSQRKVDRVENVLGLLAALVGFVLLIGYSARFVTVDLSPLVTIMNAITLPAGLLSQTWLYSAVVCVLIAWLDKYVLTRRMG
jgi:uncharacterized membrane protein (DUF485 family)